MIQSTNRFISEDDGFVLIKRAVKDDWSEVKRVPKGQPGGGQWTDGTQPDPKEAAEKKKRRERFSKEVAVNELDASVIISEFEDEMTDDEKAAVDEYTDDHYIYLNKELRQGLERSNNSEFLIKHLDKFLEDAPKYNGISHRGMYFVNKDGYESFLNKAQPGAIFMDEGYMSTSIKYNTLDTFMGNDRVYSIALQITGKNGVYLNGLSHNSSEAEVLFKRNTKFKVTKTEYGIGMLSGKKIIHLEEL